MAHGGISAIYIGEKMKVYLVFSIPEPDAVVVFFLAVI
jgi:hypothetical protein